MTKLNKPWQIHQPMVTGVCWWNHKSVKALFPDAVSPPVIHRSFSDALKAAHENNGCIVAWSSRLTEKEIAQCDNDNIPLIRMEDGFLRSVGLGAGWVPAASLILDSQGIYYDARQTSDLEWLLENQPVDETQIKRAHDLRKKIIEAKLSKYNLNQANNVSTFPSNRLKVLVPGQVSDDASVLTAVDQPTNSGTAFNVNLDLLKKARENNPDAYIIFKPHPDVASGLRKGQLQKQEALSYADHIAYNSDIIAILDSCDKVETFSSLTGFEALLRDKQVTVHGQPFYAGWGLTQDMTALPSRTQKRSVDELVYLTLIEYSRYIDPLTFKPCQVEDLIKSLEKLRQSRYLKFRNQLLLKLARVAEILPFNK